VSEPYIGQVMLYGFNFAPRNFAFAAGQQMAISQNEALFSILGTTYGGNGVTTFALPNIQERAVTNWGTGPGLTSYDLGQVFGVPNVTVTQSSMPQHNHVVNAYASSAYDLVPVTNGWYGERNAAPGNFFEGAVAPDSQMSPSAFTNAGGSLPHENEQPFLAMNYCIALYGIFPSRN
jgi:microcystin-dependent protein